MNESSPLANMKCNRKVIAALGAGVFTLLSTLIYVYIEEECVNNSPLRIVGENDSRCESKAIDTSGNLRLSVCNNSIVDIRQFVLKDNNTYQATIKGINLRVEQWDELLKITNWVQCKLQHKKSL
jgi:hypothetical protein